MKYLLIVSITLALLSCDTKQQIITESDVITKTEVESDLLIQKGSQIDLLETAPMKKPKNIILLIGDGMGLAQITAGMYSNDNKTALENFKHIGLQKTYSDDDVVTDSAASATAFGCGVKTYNNAIGVDRDTMPVKSILKYAQDHNMATGLVATSTIVHATPACFFSHNKYRRNYEEIAADMVGSGVDLFIGGGKKFFDRREMDDRNLIEELEQDGYAISHFAEQDIDEIIPSLDKKFGYLTADSDPIPVSGGRDYLIPASDLAIDYLSNKGGDNGFFVMIEGSQIDWGGHANLLDYVVSEFLEYDKVIEMAYNYALKDKNTLVVVTADHETGGLAIQPTSTMDSLQAAFTTTKHSGVMVPVFAYGPGSENFQGIYENTEIFEKMKALLPSEN